VNLDGQEPVEDRIRRLQRKQVVELAELQQLHRWLDDKREARQSGRVIGESRTGKTFGCRHYAFLHPPQKRIGRPPHHRVLCILPKADCEPSDFYRHILEELGYRLTRGTVADLRKRAHRALVECIVEMIIIDEAHRLRPKTFAAVRDVSDGAMRDPSDQGSEPLPIAVILVGTARLNAVVKVDEQVDNRFMPRHQVGRLVGQEFANTVAIWEDKVLELPVPSNLATDKKILTELLRTSRGLIGILDAVLRAAAIHALKKGKGKIDRDILRDALAEYQ